jgi:hypothetical protein
MEKQTYLLILRAGTMGETTAKVQDAIVAENISEARKGFKGTRFWVDNAIVVSREIYRREIHAFLDRLAAHDFEPKGAKREEEIRKDVFNPKETDVQYAERRKKELGL